MSLERRYIGHRSSAYEEIVKRQQAVLAEYHRRHHACPQCGAVEVEQTCMGVVIPESVEQMVDNRNRAFCVCGWEGKVHDLCSEGRSSAQSLAE